MKRHQLYYQGPLSTTPNVRPWALHRNGYPGIAQWGGWVWSGDTEASWKTLEAQIAVGINYSLSIGPYWGSDIGGFYANNELTGELYARWFQFAAFCGSFRSHGRVWWTRLPWGRGGSDMGPREFNNTNAPIPLYEDDGITQEYLRNVATVTRFTWVDRDGRLTIAPEPQTGVPNPPAPRTFEIVVFPEGTRRTVTYAGRPITLDVR